MRLFWIRKGSGMGGGGERDGGGIGAAWNGRPGAGGGRRGPMDVVCPSQDGVFQEATPIDNDADLVVI